MQIAYQISLWCLILTIQPSLKDEALITHTLQCFVGRPYLLLHGRFMVLLERFKVHHVNIIYFKEDKDGTKVALCWKFSEVSTDFRVSR